MEKLKVKEIIVVEGKDDISAVKKAVDAEVIQVNGHAIKKKDRINILKKAYETKGLIILTDPDFAGLSIRKYINENFPKSKNAYITRAEGSKNSDIGVENASPEAIIKAIKNTRCEIEEKKNFFTMSMMIAYALTGNENSVKMREALGDILGIGYGNTKQFLNKLNAYGITEEEFILAYQKVKEKF